MSLPQDRGRQSSAPEEILLQSKISRFAVYRATVET